MSNVYFSQRDPRWANKMYSSVNNASQTIKSSGCGPTSCAMLVSSLTDTIIYPDDMANYFVSAGYRTSNNGTSWSAFGRSCKKI